MYCGRGVNDIIYIVHLYFNKNITLHVYSKTCMYTLYMYTENNVLQEHVHVSGSICNI